MTEKQFHRQVLPQPYPSTPTPSLLGVADKASSRSPSMFWLYLVFFVSGFPALLYQIVWQRALFTLYGVNIESVTVVVTAFMLGLGFGSLFGGALSRQTWIPPLLAYGIMEVGIAVFGAFSLELFDAVNRLTLGASAPLTFFISFVLVLFPTLLMGATLPLLTAYLVRLYGNVGRSVGILYFVNTLGSAAACIVAAIWLFGALGQSGTVILALMLNLLVGGGAIAIHYLSAKPGLPRASEQSSTHHRDPGGYFPFWAALLLVGLSGYISLSYEIIWTRAYSFVSGGWAVSFPFLLGFFLAGIAFGSLISRFFCRDAGLTHQSMGLLAAFLFFANLIGFAVTPALGFIASTGLNWVFSLPLVALVSAMLGVVLPLISHFSIPPNARAGASLSYLYIANIVGSAAGSLSTGFWMLDALTINSVTTFLAIAGASLALLLLGTSRAAGQGTHPAGIAIVTGSIAAFVLVGPRLGDQLYERLLHKAAFSSEKRFAHVVETKSGVITVTQDGTVYGDGNYDGAFNVSLVDDVNAIIRPYAIGAFHAKPNEMLLVGLASGSWAQVLAHHPSVQRLTIVEINPGYIKVLSHYPEVSSLLENPKIEIVIDDARRWLAAHPERLFDVIVSNNTMHWRTYSSNLLSRDYLQLIRTRLKPGGMYYFNTTWSPEAQRTAAEAFPYAFRVKSMMLVSDAPIAVNPLRWRNLLHNYRIDGVPVFDVDDPAHRRRLDSVLSLTENFQPYDDAKRNMLGLEARESVLQRTKDSFVITDDNMGTEWLQLPEFLLLRKGA